MYIFVDEDGDVTQSEVLPEILFCSWPTVIRIELRGMDLVIERRDYKGEWIVAPEMVY